MTPLPINALVELAARGLALAAEVPRAWCRLASVPRVLRQAREVQVGTTPCDVVFSRRGFKLLRYRRKTRATCVEPVLFCCALVNRPYILDLQPDVSVVQRYLERGFEVYMIDWGIPTDSDRGLIMEDYVCGFLRGAVRFIQRVHARDDIHLLGYCMGGTFAALFTALYPDSVRTLTLLASPIDFRGKQSLLNVWSDPKCFDVDAFIDARGNCPASFLQNCFSYIKPVQNLIEKRFCFYEHMDDPAFVADYFAFEHWVNDSIPVAGETFREIVRKLFQRNELVLGELWLGDGCIDLRRIGCPLLLLTAKNDHLVPPASTHGLRPLVSSKDVTAMMADTGHAGLVVGRKAQKTIWAEATSWLANRSTPVKRTAPAVSAADDSTPSGLEHIGA